MFPGVKSSLPCTGKSFLSRESPKFRDSISFMLKRKKYLLQLLIFDVILQFFINPLIS